MEGTIMGYTTNFEGQFDLDKPLTAAQVAYLKGFNQTRRMKRSAEKAQALSDPVREAAGLPVGEYGEYFVGGMGFMGQDKDASVLDNNDPPPSQPGLWCQWVATDDGGCIEWDGNEKFGAYIEWLQYIIDHFLDHWGIKLSGEVTWQGESGDDRGRIVVKNNKIKTQKGRIVYE
jgi:hypothetical protein